MNLTLNYNQMKALRTLVNIYDAVEKETLSASNITVIESKGMSIKWQSGDKIELQIPDKYTNIN